jgi:hypothetical protein
MKKCETVVLVVCDVNAGPDFAVPAENVVGGGTEGLMDYLGAAEVEN